MSCQVRSTGCIQEIEAIRRCLFPTDDLRGSDNWLQQCKVAVSPVADLIVLGHERRIVILCAKYDDQSSLTPYGINYSGQIHDYDKIKAILCLPIIGSHEITKLGPKFTCILVGFDSGHIRCYTDNCDLLYEERFHAENITSIKCQSQHSPNPNVLPDLSSEQIHIQYQSVISIINSTQLCSVLRNSWTDFKKGGIVDHIQNTVVPKKWGFEEQSVINDSAVVGKNRASRFDHLLTASTCGGFDCKYSAKPPFSTIVLAAGSKPFLGYHLAHEGQTVIGFSDLAKEGAKFVANKVKSALPDWLVSKSVKQISIAMQPADDMGYRFGLCDLRRTATEIILSPDRRLAAVSDTLGRVLLLDTQRGVVLRIFKGYRDAQCSFVQVPEEKTSKHRSGDKVALFLIIYAPKKGNLEILSLQKGTKIATFTASKFSRLVHINYGLLGFQKYSKSRYVCAYTTVFIDNDGQIKEFTVPFHFALSEQDNKRSRDIYLYKQLRLMIKTGNYDEEKLLTETTNTCAELTTTEIKSQIVDLFLTNKNVPAKVFLKAVDYFAKNLTEEDTVELKVICENAAALLELYLFVNDFENGNADRAVADRDATMKPDMENLQKLLDLSISHDCDKHSGVHVSFSDDASLAATEFLSIFDITEPGHVRLKRCFDELVVFRSSGVFFERFITRSPHGFDEKVFESLLMSCKIPTKTLFHLLIHYWISRSLHIKPNLEEEISNLLRLIYTLSVSSKLTLSAEFDEISIFWEEIRTILGNSLRPFSALIAAILCKTVELKVETDLLLKSSPLEDENMEILSRENVQWSILIGKLEDVSLLNIILSKKPIVDDCSLPVLEHDEFNISLKYILDKGKGSVSELVAKWLTSTGINPKSIIQHDPVPKKEVAEEDDDDDDDKAYLEDIPPEVKTNEKALEQLDLLREKFPFSLETSSLLANMGWEYALAWKMDLQNLAKLEAAITCFDHIREPKIKQGSLQLLWNAYIKIGMENICKLVNKVGKLPVDRLCRQKTGISDQQIPTFTRITTDFLDTLGGAMQDSFFLDTPRLNFEDIWDNGRQTLVELAARQREANFDLLLMHYQLSLVLQMLTNFPSKHSKPVNNLFEETVVNLFFTDMQSTPPETCNRCDSKLNTYRSEFLCTIVTASMESVTVNEDGKAFAGSHNGWMEHCLMLARYWNVDLDILRRHQVVMLFRKGFDSLAYERMSAVKNRVELGRFLMRIIGKRISLFLATSPCLAKNYPAISVMVTRYMEKLRDECCEPCPLPRITRLSRHCCNCFDEENREYKLSQLLFEACTDLEYVNRR